MTPLQMLRWAIPSMLTIGALISGLSAVRFSAEKDFSSCVKCIFLACVLDGLDGHTARFLGTSSKFGFELDTLCDLANFGVAPALVLHFWMDVLPEESNNPGSIFVWFTCCVFTASCALRLARFNAAGHQKLMDDALRGRSSIEYPVAATMFQNLFKRKLYFQGLPAPVGAAYSMVPMALSLSKFSDHLGKVGQAGAWALGRRGTCIMLMLTSIMMISNIPTLSSKMLKTKPKTSHLRSRNTIYIVLKAVFVVVLISSVWKAPFMLFLVMVAVHLISIPVGLVMHFSASQEDEPNASISNNLSQ